MQRQKRNRLILAGLALVAAWLVYALRPATMGGQADPTAEPERNHTAKADQPEPIAASPATAAATMAKTDAVEFFNSLNRYPAGTRRLTDETHDLLNPGARHEQRMRLVDDPERPNPGWEVLYTADRYFINGEETALISLELWHHDEPAAPDFVRLVAEQPLAGDQPRVWPLTIRHTDAGVSAAFAPDTVWPDYAGPLRVKAQFAAAGLMPQLGTLDFYFTGSTRIPAEFTGTINDRLLQESLAFDIGVDVLEAGRFRIEANLFDALGRPFGWARFDGTLARGKQDVTLLFDGLLFHDARAQAPYLLTQLRGYRLNPQSASGRQFMAGMQMDYASQADYQLADFRDTVRISPRQQRMLDLYEDAQRRGVTLTNPQYTGQ